MEIKLFYHNSVNFGDYLARWITERISGKTVQTVDENYTQEHYIVTGSILTQLNDQSIVWGGGVAYYTDKIGKAKEFRAVRGKLSMKKVSESMQPCGSYGDPVLLMPDLYKPTIDKKYKLGIIPHWIDYYWAMMLYRDCPDVLVIDLLKKPEQVIDDILSCEKAISSSLHGIIASNAYGIDCQWVEFSDRVLGDGFKFHDYFSSVNVPIYTPINLRDGMLIDQIIKSIEHYEIQFDKSTLWDTCPFKQS